jgi:hypothetical protein
VIEVKLPKTEPRKNGLLDVANVTSPADSRSLLIGAVAFGEIGGAPAAIPANGAEKVFTKIEETELTFDPLGAYWGIDSNLFNADVFAAEAKARYDARRSEAIEAEFLAKVLSTATVIQPSVFVPIALEKFAVQNIVGQAVIHMTPTAFAHLMTIGGGNEPEPARYFVERNGKIYTTTGHKVVLGVGYEPIRPGVAGTDGDFKIYVTSEVDILTNGANEYEGKALKENRTLTLFEELFLPVLNPTIGVLTVDNPLVP